MATSLTDFAEQANPNTLAEARRAGFRQATRVHGSFLATAEKRALIWMAIHMPAWVSSDQLTLLGFAAQVATGVCYALAARDRCMLLAAIVCLAVNWFGDSLDGTLARVRQRQRPRYGFYVDHIIDSIGAAIMMGGLALSGYMHPAIAIGLLIAFLLLSIQSYLATYTLGEFHLSFWHFGPTELRILLAVGNLALFRWACVITDTTGSSTSALSDWLAWSQC
jgi:phosphatidylglycerophosphate synthase